MRRYGGGLDLCFAPNLLGEEQFDPLIAQAGPARGLEQFVDDNARVDDEPHQLWRRRGEISRTNSSASTPERETTSSTRPPCRSITSVSTPVRMEFALSLNSLTPIALTGQTAL